MNSGGASRRNFRLDLGLPASGNHQEHSARHRCDSKDRWQGYVLFSFGRCLNGAEVNDLFVLGVRDALICQHQHAHNN